MNPLSHCQNANKYCFLKSLGVPCFCSRFSKHLWGLTWDWEMVFSLPCHWDSASPACQESLGPGASRPKTLDLTKGLTSPGTLESKSQLHKGIWRRLGNQLGAPPIRLVRTLIWIIHLLLGGRKGAWSPSSRHPSNSIWDETVSLRFREWGENV
jgi:hypothetical protein